MTKAVVLCGVFLLFVTRHGSAATDPATTFIRKCSSCHTFGQGVLVGPDLEGATDRHSRKWLTDWISSSDRVIRSGDPTANALFNKFKRQRMPDQTLSSSELSALLDYLAAGGPEADARKKSRLADSATPAEIDLGRMLFMGERAFARGGAPCASCHRVDQTAGAGGTLGPDLSRVYARFQDIRMSSLLDRGCFPRVPYTPAKSPLTEQESFALRAFLRHPVNLTR